MHLMGEIKQVELAGYLAVCVEVQERHARGFIVAAVIALARPSIHPMGDSLALRVHIGAQVREGPAFPTVGHIAAVVRGLDFFPTVRRDDHRTGVFAGVDAIERIHFIDKEGPVTALLGLAVMLHQLVHRFSGQLIAA